MGPAQTAGSALERGADDRGRGSLSSDGKVDVLRSRPQSRDLAGCRIDRGDSKLAVDQLAEEDLVIGAEEEGVGRGTDARREVSRLSAVRRHEPDVAARRPEVAHEAVNDGDRPSVGGPSRTRDLELRLPDGASSRRRPRESRRAGRSSSCSFRSLRRRSRRRLLPSGRPVVLVDEEIGGGDGPNLPGGRVGDGDALLLDLFLDEPGVELVRDERARLLRRSFEEKKRDRPAVGGPGEVLELSGDAGDPPGGAAGGGSDIDLELPLLIGVGQKRDRLPVRGPGDVSFSVVLPVARGRDPCGLSRAADRRDPDRGPTRLGRLVDVLQPGHARSVGRDRHGGERAQGVERVEHRVDGRVSLGADDTARTNEETTMTTTRLEIMRGVYDAPSPPRLRSLLRTFASPSPSGRGDF